MNAEKNEGNKEYNERAACCFGLLLRPWCLFTLTGNFFYHTENTLMTHE
jgi:hypothetical protein